MSALQRARSRSKTAPETTGAGISQSNGSLPVSKSDERDPSSTPDPSHSAAHATLLRPSPKSPSLSAAEMLTALPTANISLTERHPVESVDAGKNGFDDHPDNRSSSLSELGDASDDHSEATPRPSGAANSIENDSEAETERLEATPRKLTRTATNTSIASEHTYERTPSKLMHSRTINQEDSPPGSPTPSGLAEDTALGDATDGTTGLDSLSMVAASEAASLELAGKKRKRSSADSSEADSQTEPARKRSSTSKDKTLNGSQNDVADNSEQVDVEEELDNAEDRIEQLAQEEIELEERQADVAAEAVNELATVVKLTKGRKGGRRGKRKLEDASIHEIVANAEANEADDAENDEEDSAALDEEVAKKKSAIDELAKIEKKFKIFRERLCDEQIAQYEQELEMLKQPNCMHPEYLAMIQCIDERRAGKIAYEKQLMEYKMKALERTTVAGRHQIHSQYFQTVRDVRETILSECNQRIYDLQRGRRQLGVEEVEYSIRLPEKRSERIRQQTAYNLEVSVLSGVAKYVGFPAAPEIKPARPSDIDEDLRAMKITTKPAAAQPVPYIRPYNRNTTADEAAAEEQFIERTPWANPHHPVHQQSHYQVPGSLSRAPSQTYQTPAGQRRVVDIHAPNGSASTIEVNSNPPSSAAGTGLNGRGAESESPVLQMRRHPSDHPPYSETSAPSSQPRNLTALGRDPYAGNSIVMSSPQTEPLQDEQGARWNSSGVRPLNVGASSGPTNAGRQVPLAQRSNLGTISVGIGNGLFGR